MTYTYNLYYASLQIYVDNLLFCVVFFFFFGCSKIECNDIHNQVKKT